MLTKQFNLMSAERQRNSPITVKSSLVQCPIARLPTHKEIIHSTFVFPLPQLLSKMLTKKKRGTMGEYIDPQQLMPYAEGHNTSYG